MATSLSSLFPDSRWTINASTTNYLNTIYVYNTSINSVSNGGQCCLWTVPANASWVRFEMWGGGGTGAASCCCMSPMQSGASGSYGRKTTRVVPGESYTVCAASSGCWGCCNNGAGGYTSFVQGGSTYAINICAGGGGGGCTGCGTYGNWCNCLSFVCQAGVCNVDFALCGVNGGMHNGAGCAWDGYGYVAEPTYIGTGLRMQTDSCSNNSGYNSLNNTYATFPGGGGASAIANGGNCYCGAFGAGGLVIITYK